MMETITLKGGPLDGKSFGWNQGDYYYAVATEMQPIPVTAKADDPVPNMPLEHLVYRRSDDNPRIFEFQPSEAPKPPADEE